MSRFSRAVMFAIFRPEGGAILCGGVTRSPWRACILHTFEPGRMPAP